jgi:acylphosphatase
MEEKHQSSQQARLHAVVEGLVQGVNFRYYTMRTAHSLGLVGWVANRWDGKVETVAEGPRADLERFLAFLHEGSPSSITRGVTSQWGEATGQFSTFDVRYL